MAAQVQRKSVIAAIGEVVEKVVVPAPGAVEGAVYEQQRCGVGGGGRTLVDHLEHSRTLSTQAAVWQTNAAVIDIR